ncbi:DUF4942 domain-containing protein [Photorhabdus sp. RM71S]|uniref:DUF4942 domain-containing protein n=1 Tax=Photorhabdus sp. RM71S TaxID=3342824 RepID=UPI0036DAAB8D
MENKKIPEYCESVGLHIADNVGKRNQHFNTEYFSVKWFKKGTLHLTFTKPDLIGRVNDMVAEMFPNALPPIQEG